MPLNDFARKVGFKNGEAYGFKGMLREFERLGVLEVKQEEFMDDSLRNPKMVIIRNMEYVERGFGLSDFTKDRACKWKRRPKCRHGDFSVVAVVSEVPMSNPSIRKVILKCSRCDFHVERLEVAGVISVNQRD